MRLPAADLGYLSVVMEQIRQHLQELEADHAHVFQMCVCQAHERSVHARMLGKGACQARGQMWKAARAGGGAAATGAQTKNRLALRAGRSAKVEAGVSGSEPGTS